MTFTLPTLYPAGYAGDDTDFLKTKMDRSGANRTQRFKVSVPAATASATIIGLIPFNKGMELNLLGSYIAANTALDTGSTIVVSVGYTYYDSTLGTSLGTAFVSSATTWQGSALTALTLLNGPESVGQWRSAADGWLTLTITTGPTTTTGDVFGAFTFAYDQSLGQ